MAVKKDNFVKKKKGLPRQQNWVIIGSKKEILR